MATREYKIALYRSAIDGLVLPNGGEHRYGTQKQPISTLSHALISNSFPNCYSHLDKSKRFPTDSKLTCKTITEKNRINQTSNTIHNSNTDFVNRNLITSIDSRLLKANALLVRAESLNGSNMHLGQLKFANRPKFDARHFCGLDPIYENRHVIREIPSFDYTNLIYR